MVLLPLLTGNFAFSQEQRVITDSMYSFVSDSAPGLIHINPASLHYVSHEEQKVNFGVVTGRWCYIVFKVPPIASDDYVMSVDNTSIDSVVLFRMNAGGTLHRSYLGGNLIPYNRHRKYVWHIQPIARSEMEGYYLAAFQDQGRNINVGYKILTTDSLDRLYSGFERLIWFYLGIAFIVFVIVTTGWLIFNNMALIYYALYILCVTAWLVEHYGYLYPMVYPDFPELNAIIKPLTILGALLFFCRLIATLFPRLLKEDKISTVLLRSVFGSGLFLLLTVLAYPFLPKVSPVPAWFNVIWNGFFGISFVVILLIVIRLFGKSIVARWFTLALGLIVLMSIQQILSNSGFFYSRILNDHGMLLASIAEIGILTFAVFKKTGDDKNYLTLQVAKLEDEHYRTLAELIMVQDNERKRIAAELHDSIGPMLAAIKINFQRLVRVNMKNQDPGALVEKTEDIIDSSMMEIRNIAHQLMPKELVAKGLAGSLSDYIRDLREIYQIPIRFKHSITTISDRHLQLNLYRIMCELILNAAKHSKASCITAMIDNTMKCITATVDDNGCGFEPEQVETSSLGLKNIRSRIEYLKGDLKISSVPGQGTQVLITIPQKVELPN